VDKAENKNLSMYREHILELWKHPENYGAMAERTHEARGFNELCGDDIVIQLQVVEGRVKNARFTGTGCALCFASSSMFTEKIKGLGVEDILKMGSQDILRLLEVDIHPARIKCVLLPLETGQKALKGQR
jgi:nitrogen fixation protein NifU and related proteins